MWIELAEIRETGKPLHLRRELTGPDLDLDPSECTLSQPAVVEATVRLLDDIARIKGRVEGRLNLPCCRCLEPVPLEVDKSFQVEYCPDPELAEEGEEFELEYEDLETGFYRGDKIDLAGLVNEQLLLEVPMKPICRPDCKGLCPQCGANWNEESCECSQESLDPRLAVLAKLKERMK
ncbi:MAG TPA: DUF177 domain-containing protein [Acidobacteriota bacterium]|nr:DUF177 domain-containing protein [Acidobacteriota bacterium]